MNALRCAHCTRVMPVERRQRNCELCIAAGAKRSMKTYHARRAAGVCGRCGDELGERVGKSLCATCNSDSSAFSRNKMPVLTEQRRRRRQRKRARVALLRMRVAK